MGRVNRVAAEFWRKWEAGFPKWSEVGQDIASYPGGRPRATTCARSNILVGLLQSVIARRTAEPEGRTMTAEPECTLAEARAAKPRALAVFSELADVVGVGITRVGNGYGIKVNLSAPASRASGFRRRRAGAGRGGWLDQKGVTFAAPRRSAQILFPGLGANE